MAEIVKMIVFFFFFCVMCVMCVCVKNIFNKVIARRNASSAIDALMLQFHNERKGAKENTLWFFCYMSSQRHISLSPAIPS